MLKELKTLGKESLIYGLATVLARFLNFILLPFYTYYLAPAEYGIVAAVFSYIAFLNIVYHYGLDQAYMRYYSEKEKAFSISMVCLFVTSVVITAVLCGFAPFWASAGGIGPENVKLVYYSAAILILDTATIVPFAELRMSHRPLRFAGIKTVNIVINIIFNVYFLKYAGTGIDGVFMANIISSAVSVLLLAPQYMTFRFVKDSALLKNLLAFALPLLPAGLGSMIVQVLDRPIMLKLADPASVGLYQANYRLGIFMMLIVNMFDQAWRPFFIERAGNADAPKIFSKVLTYFTAGGLCVWLIMSFFISDAVKIPFHGISLINPQYWGGLQIVPIVLAAYLLNGVYINFLAPVIIAKKTGIIMYITFSGAAVSVAGNFCLIPLFGINGAAWALLASYSVMAILLYYAGRKYYRVDYEFSRIFKLAAAAAVCGLPVYIIGSGAYLLPAKIICTFIFPVLVWNCGFLTKAEKEYFKKNAPAYLAGKLRLRHKAKI